MMAARKIADNSANTRKPTSESVERDLVMHFMGCVIGKKPLRYVKLDRDKSRSRPDYAIYYGKGIRYTIELERWLPLEVRKLEDQACKIQSRILSKKLPGIFIWYIPIELAPDWNLLTLTAKSAMQEIKGSIQTLPVSGSHPLSLGTLVKVSDSGSKLVIEVLRKEPLNFARHPRLMHSLKATLNQILTKGEKKFYKYRGARVLLLNVEQSGIDLDYHARPSKYSEGVVRRWVKERIKSPTKIDYVCLAQGMRVWHGVDVRILTGHKYVDQPHPNYEEVWRRQGLPPISDSLQALMNKPIKHA
jgi:hypothetical protein